MALLGFILSGCAANNRDMSDVANQLRHNLPVETALARVEALEFKSQSSAQHQLNLGYLQLINGDYQNALINLEGAKQTMASLQAASISENLTSATINETLRSYSGWPTDQALVHGMMAMAYLLSNDLNGARVEILQANVQMNKLAESGGDQGQLAFVRYLAGVIYELNHEYDNAVISYRMALAIITSRKGFPPLSLQQNLVDLTARIGLKEESKKYQEQFGLGLSKPYSNKQFIFSFDGVVTQMAQAKSTLWWDIDDVYLSVALPTFPRNNYVVSPFYIHTKEGEITTQTIENIESRARDDLQARMPKITAMALARAGAKFQTVKELNKKDNVLGAFANVLTIISEVADLRHWGMLPSSIQIATSYDTSGTLYSSSRYGLQMGQYQEKEQEAVETLATDKSGTEEIIVGHQVIAEDSVEDLILRKQVAKSKTAKARANTEDFSKVNATADKTFTESTVKINNSAQKNAVILLSSLTNRIHVASF